MITALLVLSVGATIHVYYAKALEADAERLNMERVVTVLRHAVINEYARNGARGFDMASKLLASNPMNLLVEKPTNYLGEFSRDPYHVTPGYWYFAKDSGLLIYQVKAKDRFKSSVKGMSQARFKIQAEATPDKASTHVAVRFVVVEPYAWK
jgi:hypothetical protein